VIAALDASWATLDPLWGLSVCTASPAGVWSVCERGLSPCTSLARSRTHAIRAFAAVTSYRTSSKQRGECHGAGVISPAVARPQYQRNLPWNAAALGSALWGVLPAVRPFRGDSGVLLRSCPRTVVRPGRCPTQRQEYRRLSKRECISTDPPIDRASIHPA
jgi:hypothetical protein